MQKKLPLIIGAVVTILIIGGGIIGFSVYKSSTENKNSSPNSSNTSNNSSSSNSSNSSNALNFKTPADFFSFSGSLECVSKEGGVNQIVYVKNGMVSTKTEKTNAILKNSKLYSWEDGKTEGITLDFNNNDIFKDSPATANTNSTPEIREDFNTFKDTCKSVNLGDEKFNLPKEVNFQDFGAMMKDLQKTGGEANPFPADTRAFDN